jgi:hypothetical protein
VHTMDLTEELKTVEMVKCSLCTFENTADRHKCQMCENALPKIKANTSDIVTLQATSTSVSVNLSPNESNNTEMTLPVSASDSDSTQTSEENSVASSL